jgi:peptidoglycan hydrolase-like protein with peptidoglycan-binding domain
LFWGVAMRNFFLSVFAMVTVFGIPRLANEYRGVRMEAIAPPAIMASAASISAAPREAAAPKPIPALAPVQEIASAPAPIVLAPGAPVAVEKPAAVQLLPVTLNPSGIAPAAASPAATLPKNNVELIASIQTELRRLGVYNGPSNGRWNKYVRHAVREFTARKGGYVRNPKPTLELLASLQDAGLVKAQVKPEAKSHVDAKPVRQAEYRPDAAPMKEAAPAQESAPNDDYLPPWMKRNASGAVADATPAPADAAAVATASRPVRHRRHRRSWDWDFGW